MRWLAYMLVSSALTLSAQQTLGTSPNLYSRAREATLGAQFARQVRQMAAPVDNASALSYVEEMGAKLAAQLPEPRFSYAFALIAAGAGDTLKEPVALPGGYIFVPTSLFLTARDDSEFAGMLAHAMAHVAERHGTRAATRNVLDQTAASRNAIAGRPAVIPVAFNGIPASYVAFSRADEQEADGLALTMVAAGGYDVQGLIRYVNSLPESEARNQRIAAIQNAIRDLSHPASGEFLQIQKQLGNP